MSSPGITSLHGQDRVIPQVVEALQNLQNDEDRLARERRARFDESPPPYSPTGETTDSVGASPPMYSEFPENELDRWGREWEAWRERSVARGKSLPNNHRWVEQGIWAQEWGPAWAKGTQAFSIFQRGDGPFCGKQFNLQSVDPNLYSWGHERIPKADRPQTQAQAQAQPSTSFGASASEQHSEPTGRTLTVQDLEASRPCHQFIAQIAYEREWLKQLDCDTPGASIDLDALAYDNVKTNWKEDGIWDDAWGETPGQTWYHERVPSETKPIKPEDRNAQNVRFRAGIGIGDCNGVRLGGAIENGERNGFFFGRGIGDGERNRVPLVGSIGYGESSATGERNAEYVGQDGGGTIPEQENHNTTATAMTPCPDGPATTKDEQQPEPSPRPLRRSARTSKPSRAVEAQDGPTRHITAAGESSENNTDANGLAKARRTTTSLKRARDHDTDEQHESRPRKRGPARSKARGNDETPAVAGPAPARKKSIAFKKETTKEPKGRTGDDKATSKSNARRTSARGASAPRKSIVTEGETARKRKRLSADHKATPETKGHRRSARIAEREKRNRLTLTVQEPAQTNNRKGQRGRRGQRRRN
ncbi:hypothetical protein E4U41_006981 [Claviceps citrina]|nr:hypothetical protein E4U41_006981 [Claviceps citrina]